MDWCKVPELPMLCMQLLEYMEHKMPTADFEGLEEVAKLKTASVHHYEVLGEPFAAFSRQDLLQGY